MPGPRSQHLKVSQTPTVANVTMTDADTEYSYTFPDSTRKYTLRLRGANALKLSFTSGASGTTYITVDSGATYSEDNIDMDSLIVYVQSTAAAQTLEVISWK